ncbi:hypothetical protein ACTXKN_05745 [Brachybacterium alimentarium]|uniref:hypothetical protein n=1 Tax=Brachybacterium alimentarium TaxID=47845 RepID=UPI003FD36E54
MEIFSDLDDFTRVTSGTTKWLRAAQAIRTAPSHREGAMHSIGDSLTYLRTRRRHETELFTGHRRYLEVIAAGETPVALEVAASRDLTARGDYSDLTDREHFEGVGRAVRLDPGQILVTEIGEALRYVGAASSAYTVVHVSVEGATFHNK